MTDPPTGPVARVARGVRDTLRLLAPGVWAERAYTRGRARAMAEALAAAARAGRAWPGPARWGRGYDERVAEYPWAFARLEGATRLLDVGSTLNHAEHVARLRACGIAVTFLNPWDDDGWRSGLAGVRYVRRDVREPGTDIGTYAVVTCLSVLEHVGCANERYGAPPGQEADAAAARRDAMRAMRGLLEPGGRLLLTVPFGRHEDHAWFVQFDGDALDDAVAAFGAARAAVDCFVYDDGWRAGSRRECASLGYGTRTRGASAVACVELVVP